MIYRDIYDGPPRSYINERTTKRWVVIHSTQNDASAEGEASYAKRRPDGISSHYYVDRDSIVQSLDTDLGAHHVGSATGNRGGVSYELTGFAAWSRSRWLDSVAWPLLAAAVARDCAEHGVVPRALTVAQIRAGTTGVMTHNQARLAWGHTDHTDPGPNFPMDHLVRQVQAMGDDMPFTKDDLKTMLKTDGVFTTPKLHANGEPRTKEELAANPHWWLQSVIDASYDNIARARKDIREHGVKVEAALAAAAGRDVSVAVRAELERAAEAERAERAAELTALRDGLAAVLLAELGPALVAELGDAAGGLSASVVEAAVGRALARTSLTVAPDES